MAQPRSAQTRGYIAALLAAAFLSTTAIFIRYLTQNYNLPPLVLAVWRNVFVVMTLLPVLGLFFRRRLRVNRADLGYLVLYGLVLSFFNAFWTLSVAINGAAVATVLVYSSVAFTALLGAWWLKERLTWVKATAAAITLGGCALVAGAYDPALWSLNVSGIAVGLLAGLMYAVYSLFGRQASRRGLNPWTTLFYTFGFAGVFLIVANLLPGGFLPSSAKAPGGFLALGTAWAGWGVLFLLAAGPTVAGFGFYNVSLSLLPSSTANLIVTLEPAFTATTAYFLLGERMSLVQVIGSLVTLGGVVFLRLASNGNGD